MSRQKYFRPVAFGLVLIYFSLTGVFLTGAGGHGLMHGQKKQHSAEHASVLCSWMCATSSHLHSPETHSVRDHHPVPIDLGERVEELLKDSRPASFRIRPPPLMFA